MSLPWPTECAVEHLLDGTQGDPIVIGTDQEVEPGERSIEKLGLSRTYGRRSRHPEVRRT
jgi:hypothetical protein